MASQLEAVFEFDSQSFLKKLFLFLVFIEGGILLADIFLNFLQWIEFRPLRRVFNITREDSFSNWFSSLQLLCVGMVVLVIFLIEKIRGWAFISFFFIFMAIDDATKLHERVGTAFQLSPLGQIISFYPSYAWQVVFGPFFIGCGIFLVTYLWRRLKEQRKYILLALSLYAIAVGLDFLEGQDHSIYGGIGLLLSTKTQWVVHFAKALEEVLEMFGTSIFLVAFLHYLLSLHEGFLLRWKKPLK